MDQPEEVPSHDLPELPLFPLNVVLFPGMPLPLHIFEERYKAMIRDCLERKGLFGVVLISEGREVGDPAQPFYVGTSARIRRVEHLEEGRMNILTQGERRFTTAEITQRLPHLVGRVQYLEEEAGDIPAKLLAEAREGYATLLRNLTALTGGWTARSEAPADPVRLSYEVAANLDLPSQVRQQVLEMATARERLELLLPSLKQGIEALRQEVVKRNPYQGPRLN
jgi:Lon protease-like protein